MRGRRCRGEPGAAAAASPRSAAGRLSAEGTLSPATEEARSALPADRGGSEKFQCNILEQTLHRLRLVHGSVFLTAVAGIAAPFLRAAFSGLGGSLGRQWELRRGGRGFSRCR